MKKQLVFLISAVLCYSNVIAMFCFEEDLIQTQVKQLHKAIQVLDLPKIHQLANRETVNVTCPVCVNVSMPCDPTAVDAVIRMALSYKAFSQHEKMNDSKIAFDMVVTHTMPSMIKESDLLNLIKLDWNDKFESCFAGHVSIALWARKDFLKIAISDLKHYKTIQCMIANKNFFNNKESLQVVLKEAIAYHKDNSKKSTQKYVKNIKIARKLYRIFLSRIDKVDYTMQDIQYLVDLGWRDEILFAMISNPQLIEKKFNSGECQTTFLEAAVDKKDYNFVSLFIRLRADIYTKPCDGSWTLFEKVMKLPHTPENNCIKQLFIQAALNRFYN